MHARTFYSYSQHYVFSDSKPKQSCYTCVTRMNEWFEMFDKVFAIWQIRTMGHTKHIPILSKISTNPIVWKQMPKLRHTHTHVCMCVHVTFHQKHDDARVRYTPATPSKVRQWAERVCAEHTRGTLWHTLSQHKHENATTTIPWHQTHVSSCLPWVPHLTDAEACTKSYAICQRTPRLSKHITHDFAHTNHNQPGYDTSCPL